MLATAPESHIYCIDQIQWFNFLFWCGNNTVLMVWLGLEKNKTNTWLGSRKAGSLK